MDHGDNVGVVLEGKAVAGFLIAAVPEIRRVLVDSDLWDAARSRSRRVAAVVVDDDDQIYHLRALLRVYASIMTRHAFLRSFG